MKCMYVNLKMGRYLHQLVLLLYPHFERIHIRNKNILIKHH